MERDVVTVSELESLDPELRLLILLDLDLPSLMAFCATSRTLAAICASEFFWRQKTFRDIGTPETTYSVLEQELSPLGTWKNFYMQERTQDQLIFVDEVER